MKVEFTFNDGKIKQVDHRVAAALVKLKRGSYMTTELAVDARPIRTRTERVSLEPEANTELSAQRVKLDDTDLDKDGDGSDGAGQQGGDSTKPDIDAMELPELREYAKSIGAAFHHSAGADKVRVAIREHMAAGT